MATYTEHYNLKMPSGQDAPDVEDFNTNAEIIDTVLKAHSDNTADEYSPDETYTAGRLVIQNNALWKAKQDISVAETWTPDHWDPTTLAAELSAVNSSLNSRVNLTGYVDDVFAFFDTCPAGITFFATQSATTNIPADALAWRYAPGLIFKRGNNQGSVILFGYNTSQMAVAGRGTTGWSDWDIK